MNISIKKIFKVFSFLTLCITMGSNELKPPKAPLAIVENKHFKQGKATTEFSQSVQDMIERVNPTVVLITSTSITNVFDKKNKLTGQSKSISVGSGVIISQDGEVITNYHVIEKPDEKNTISQVIEVTLLNGKTYQATIFGNDKGLDISFLKIKASSLSFAKLGDSDNVRVGDPVVVIGNPYGLTHSVSSGIISFKNREASKGRVYLQTDAAINHGNSGGPLLNLNGEVIGIVSLILPEAQNIGLVVPINQVKKSYKILKGISLSNTESGYSK